MRFTHRIMALPVLTALVFVLVFGFAYTNLREGTRLIVRLQTELVEAVGLAHQLELDALRLRHDLDAAISVRDPEQVGETEAIADRIRANLDRGRGLPSVRGDRLRRLSTAFERYDALARRVTLALIEARGIPDDRLLEEAMVMNEAYATLQAQVDALASAQVATVRQELAGTRERLQRRARTATLLGLGAILVLVLLALLAIVAIVRPLRQLRQAAVAIARGDLDTRIDLDVRADDDIGQLALSFRDMQHALEADIAHREEVEAALRESEERLALALDAANDGIWDIDVAAGTFYTSDRFAAILGYTPDEKPRTVAAMRAMLEGVDPDEMERLFAEERADGREAAIEARMRRKDGTRAWVEIKGRTVERDAAGAPRRIVGTIADISARKEAEEKLRWAQDRLLQSEKLASLGRLVAGLAHELNSPLGALLSGSDLGVRGVQLLRERATGDDPQVDRALQALERGTASTTAAAARLRELLGGLKSFTALDRAELQEADLHELLEATLTVMGDTVPAHVNVERDYATLPRVVCYPSQLGQLFLALLRNAVEAMPEGGTLTLRTSSPGDGTVRVAVADTGRGIPEHELPGLFEPRFRDGPERVHLGWGLVTASRIAGEHGGRIEVASHEGRGSTFTLVLPVRPRREGGPAGPGRPAAADPS